jgi:hypothetical protein
MNFDSEAFIRVAEVIYDFPSKSEHIFMREGELRSCIGRSYYGAYLKVRLYLQFEQNISLETIRNNGDKDKDEHTKVRQIIREVAKRVGERDIGIALHDDLDALRVLRNRVDYEDPSIDLETLERLAKDALEYAYDILDDLNTLRLSSSQPPPPSKA